MKRELKFRVYAACDDGLKMKYLGKVECDNGLWFDSDEHIDDYENYIMQYTGFRDKEGKEIYEADIVNVDNSEPEEKGQYDVITVCKWDNGSFILEDNAGGHWTRQLFHNQHRLNVIGNIYENPELINK